jgi:SAM-dependent MidA family methyltransferase
MRYALHDPIYGYYTTGIQGIGRGHDFSTAPALGGILAQAVANWMSGVFARAEALDIVELGGGDGTFARELLRSLRRPKGWTGRYRIVESSSRLRLLQKQRLRFRSVMWHWNAEEALDAAQGRAMIVANEWFDAFPCRLFEFRSHRWNEVMLRCNENGVIVEEIEPLASEVLGKMGTSAFTALGTPSEGQRCEVHSACVDWLQSIARYWRDGSFLIVDYGKEVEHLFRRKPFGSLRAYFQHMLLEGTDVYARPGRQDITADVNFTDLRIWGEHLGWEVAFCETLSAFMKSYAPCLAESLDTRGFNRRIMDPEDAGGAFRALCFDCRRAT